MTEYYSPYGDPYRREAGPLIPYINSFISMLWERGYTEITVRTKVKLAVKIGQWMQQEKLSVKDVNEQTLNQFLEFRRTRANILEGDLTTLRILLEHLRDIEATSPPQEIEADVLHRIIGDFKHHLHQERGLSQEGIRKYASTVQNFLTDCFGNDEINLEKLCSVDVSEFFLQYAKTVKPATANRAGHALRAFFSYLRLHGKISIDLKGFIPNVANWKLSSLPKSIRPSQVELIIKSCDRTTKVGRRDYAILLILARLGLRAGEVSALTLDDIDWEAGEFLVHGKSRRQERLPLSHDVGEALGEYLQHGRPRCKSRHVFVRIRAPHKEFATSQGISLIVRRAILRANIVTNSKGSHLLRHSLACQMLNSGASLAEIGEVLRHRSVASTEVYAKVDVAALKALAHSWLGGDV